MTKETPGDPSTAAPRESSPAQSSSSPVLILDVETQPVEFGVVDLSESEDGQAGQEQEQMSRNGVSRVAVFRTRREQVSWPVPSLLEQRHLLR